MDIVYTRGNFFDRVFAFVIFKRKQISDLKTKLKLTKLLIA